MLSVFATGRVQKLTSSLRNQQIQALSFGENIFLNFFSSPSSQLQRSVMTGGGLSAFLKRYVVTVTMIPTIIREF